MIKKLYAVLDVRAENFGPPIAVNHEVEARRSFAQVVNESGTPFNTYPGDFKLVFVGTFNDSTGVILQEGEVPFTVCFGTDVLRKD